MPGSDGVWMVGVTSNPTTLCLITRMLPMDELPLVSVVIERDWRMVLVWSVALASQTATLYAKLGCKPDSDSETLVVELPWLVRTNTGWLALLTAAMAEVSERLVKELCMIWLWPPPSPRMRDIMRKTRTFGVKVLFAKRPTWPGTESFSGAPM